ncbi:C11orf42 [Branchiostoma lanceolatum]|uniref:C11orf42 protein n=1 Tax=Branchiostoma lanceolatum TaxID=7740 RepID=A0A8K0ESJ7_BRALA|nr:C11orf42 [Branchiostoma lanceolatum]
MDASLYDSLLGADVEHAWSLVGPQVVLGLLGNDAIAVSSLEQAAAFGLLAVFVKKVKPRSEKVIEKSGRFQLLGTLPDLCSPAPGGSKVAKAAPQKWAWFRCPYLLDMVSWRKEEPKEIHVRIQGVRKFSAQLTFTKGDLTLVPWLYGLQHERHVYVITDVFRADDVSLEVSVGGRTDRLVSAQQRLLAFKWKKYRLSRTRPGVLKEPWVPVRLCKYQSSEFILSRPHGHRREAGKGEGNGSERELLLRTKGASSEAQLASDDSAKWAVRLTKSAGALLEGSTSAEGSMRSREGHDLQVEDMEVEDLSLD